MYLGQCARSGGIRSGKPTADFTLASHSLSPLTVWTGQHHRAEPLSPLNRGIIRPMNLDFSDESLVDLGRQALAIEIDGLRAQVPRLGPQFARACRICLDCRGRIVVTGMGKSGHIGGKIAATLASTGTPAFF